MVGGPEQLVHPAPRPALGRQLAGQVRVPERQPPVGGDEPDLPPQSLVAGERGQLGGRREFGVLGQELGVLARQAVKVPAAASHLTVGGAVRGPALEQVEAPGGLLAQRFGDAAQPRMRT